ncbi:DUF803-domain-containing protein [Basidiobolus meristosporus CBS 931.73]|uniref:DUF803-domain-containing protein n=1 Tax=Basidiobolus meristosporus CBS 931.73 TaxID=1314790 RepID=A0A1Y1XB57_9FUNG|nr:DUF803-domain-containing protein [Basidiobolus meristosporus CBS 931.73]|eukprot:ORX82953.1 DUF803-domain-containing protein [Basidiobolus meristosporus CBS 931.73]
MVLESGAQETSAFIGVLFAICGNILISVALNIQKYAHNKLRSKTNPTSYSPLLARNSRATFHNDDGSNMSTRVSTSIDSDLDYLKSKTWWSGLILMTSGECGNFLAYGFAPASVVAPLGTVALISNTIVAPLVLNERFRRRDLMGIMLAIVGAFIVVASSSHEEVQLTHELLKKALLQTQFIVYFLITSTLIIFMIPLSDRIGEKSILIDLGLVALFGAYTVLATKAISSLLSFTLIVIFSYPLTYLMLFVLISTAVLQIKYLNKSLQRFDSTEVIPTQFVLFTISAIIGSAILYNDFANMTSQRLLWFATGCSFTFAGVYFITSNRDTITLDTEGYLERGSEVEPSVTPHSVSVKIHRSYSYSASPDNGGSAKDSIFPSSLPEATGFLRSIVNRRMSTASLSTSFRSALSSIGTRHTHALGLGIVVENYSASSRKNSVCNSHLNKPHNHS